MERVERRDVISPLVFGYDTPFCLGDGRQTGRSDPLTYCLNKGIRAGAFDSGSFFFDFSGCEETPVVIHRESLWNNVEPNEDGSLSDRCVSERLSLTENRQRSNQSFYRSVLLAHILLLENAGRLIGGASFQLPRVEQIHDAFSCFDISEASRSTAVERSGCLRLGTNVIARSFSDLDLALSTGSDRLLRALELHKLSHYRTLDQRFAESVVLSWTVCENMIDFIWNRMINDIKTSDQARMTNKRGKKLINPAVYTSSVRIEMLELSGYLSITQANNLNKVRRVRNRWLHSLEHVDERSSLESISTCAHLISSVFEIEICDWIVAGACGEGGGLYVDLFNERYPGFDLSNAYDG